MIRTLAAAALVSLSCAATAAPLDGAKTVYLVDGAETRTAIADVVFTPGDPGASYALTMREAPFTDHFLSMRPFRCLEGPAKHWCHVPYPYEIRREVTPEDLADLEYDLLFVWKGATEYGINMWNGVYYRLEIVGERIEGAIYEMDMDTLSAPPDPGDLRPVREQDLEEGDPESHWLARVAIE